MDHELERRPLVSYQGEPGAFSEAAAERLWPAPELRPRPTLRKVFEDVDRGRADFGIVPVDNSQAGSINETYDLFLGHGLHLVAEVVARVDHCLLALPGTELDDVREVVSHPQAIAQCEEFLDAHGLAVRPSYDTAGAARRIAEEKEPGVGAVASQRAGDLYGLVALATRIQTYPDNFTRFAVLARDPASLRPPDKTSLVFGVRHVAGSLVRCLAAFGRRGLNLTKLESRPRAGRPWEYVFYADIEAPATSGEMVDALAEVGEHATFTRVLGSYGRDEAGNRRRPS